MKKKKGKKNHSEDYMGMTPEQMIKKAKSMGSKKHKKQMKKKMAKY